MSSVKYFGLSNIIL